MGGNWVTAWRYGQPWLINILSHRFQPEEAGAFMKGYPPKKLLLRY
jgi:hypothetical protein